MAYDHLSRLMPRAWDQLVDWFSRQAYVSQWPEREIAY